LISGPGPKALSPYAATTYDDLKKYRTLACILAVVWYNEGMNEEVMNEQYALRWWLWFEEMRESEE